MNPAKHPSHVARFSVASAIASHFGFDVAEARQYRYQPTRTPCAVYAVDDGYFTATKGAKKPREADDHFTGQWKWNEVAALGYAKAMGWHIWRHVADDE